MPARSQSSECKSALSILPSPHRLLVSIVAFPSKLTLATCPLRKVLLLPTLSFTLWDTEQGERGQKKKRHPGYNCEHTDGWEMRNKKGCCRMCDFKTGLFPWCVSSLGSLSYTEPCVTRWTMASIGLLKKKYRWIQGMVYPCFFPKMYLCPRKYNYMPSLQNYLDLGTTY